jgi:hypothetical protein
MSLFICDCCGCVDNTAFSPLPLRDHEPWKCTMCKYGKWHGKFEREFCDRELYEEIGDRNFIYWMLGG